MKHNRFKGRVGGAVKLEVIATPAAEGRVVAVCCYRPARLLSVPPLANPRGLPHRNKPGCQAPAQQQCSLPSMRVGDNLAALRAIVTLRDRPCETPKGRLRRSKAFLQMCESLWVDFCGRRPFTERSPIFLAFCPAVQCTHRGLRRPVGRGANGDATRVEDGVTGGGFAGRSCGYAGAGNGVSGGVHAARGGLGEVSSRSTERAD